MAELKVERRGMPGWLMAALLAVAAIVLLWFLSSWLRPDVARVGSYDPARDTDISVVYEGRTWIPADVSQAAQFPEEQMVAVGEQDGYTLWANREQGLGGGGGGGVQPPDRLETGAYHRIYLQLSDGRYLPMVWRSAVPAPSRTNENPIR